MQGNPYLIQTIKSPHMLNVREAEVEVLRDALFKAREETFQCYRKIDILESYLYQLAQLILAGEIEEAQEIANLSLKLLEDKDVL